MSGRSSPVNGGYEAARLTVRKDLFPEVRLPKSSAEASDDGSTVDDDESISCVKLETDFEQSIDDIAKQKLQIANGNLVSPKQPRHRKHKQHSRRDTDSVNGCLPPETKRKKRSHHKSRSMNSSTVQVKGGKNLNLVTSSECQDNEETSEEEPEDEDDADYQAEESDDSSDDEVLKYSVKLPIINVPRQSGKPYSHELSQLSTRKSKKDLKEKRTHVIMPCSGKPRSMLDICSSRSKKKKKTECTTLYQSQIVDTNTIKIKIRRTSIHETVSILLNLFFTYHIWLSHGSMLLFINLIRIFMESQNLSPKQIVTTNNQATN